MEERGQNRTTKTKHSTDFKHGVTASKATARKCKADRKKVRCKRKKRKPRPLDQVEETVAAALGAG